MAIWLELDFQWNNSKAETNVRAHGVSFEWATTVFKDSFGIEIVDNRQDYGEVRLILIGMADGETLLYIVYTERSNYIRIISARRATKRERQYYYEQNG
jgi:uncharacterized DUF497 family protein